MWLLLIPLASSLISSYSERSWRISSHFHLETTPTPKTLGVFLGKLLLGCFHLHQQELEHHKRLLLISRSTGKKKESPKSLPAVPTLKQSFAPDSAVLSRDASVEQAEDSADRSIGLGRLPPQVYPLRLPEELPSLLFAWLAIMFLLQALAT